jgi:hypothetical protein
LAAENRKIKVLKAPGEITGFKYLMIWHSRVNTDVPRMHGFGARSGELARRSAHDLPID